MFDSCLSALTAGRAALQNAFRVLLPLLLIVAPASVFADAAGSADYAGFERFPGATIVDYRQEAATTYNLPLGRMQRSAGTVAPGRAERFQGYLRRITYEIPDGYPAAEVYGFYRDQLVSQDQQVLFSCQGRGCGSSNFWANDVFGNRILYGPEAGQFYLASTYQGVREDEDVDGYTALYDVNGYAALYVVTRTNRRMYVHIDFLELPAQQAAEQREGLDTTPQALERRLMREGAVVITGLGFNDNDELVNNDGIALIIDVLRRNGLLKVYIVGHLQDDGALIDLQARSAQRAATVMSWVMAAGIDADRLLAVGLGPLAPYCRPGPCGERIELVMRP
jgi:outer membrane protein OmpA-like peptidoglycan-associated protein